MIITLDDLESFRSWLINRNRDKKTANSYVIDVRKAFDHPKGPLGAIADRTIAPKTAHRRMSSLRAFAKFRQDTDLLTQLEDVRLPPNQRATPKMPLTRDQWAAVVQEIDSAPMYLKPEEIAIIGLMAVRGFRIGDVLRMTRRDVEMALRASTLSFEAKRRQRTEYGVGERMRHYLEMLFGIPGWTQVYELVCTKTRSKSDDLKTIAALNVNTALKSVAQRIGVPPKEMHAHRLRRTYATYYLEAVGGNLEKLRQHMDWSNINTAAMYADHNQRKELDKVSESMMSNISLRPKADTVDSPAAPSAETAAKVVSELPDEEDED
jgi:site-specific recombinase XerD